MKKLFMILALVLVLCFAYGCEMFKEPEEPAVDIAAETEAVREGFWVAANAITAKDAELAASTWADDMISFSGDKEATREWFTNRFAQGFQYDNYSLDKIEISASGDFGYVAFSFDYVREEEGEAEVTGKGYNVSVWKKQADGTWKQVAF
ncbi:YybH family protein [Acidobacteriota bacterium]